MALYDVGKTYVSKTEIIEDLNEFSERARRNHRACQSNPRYYQVKCLSATCPFNIRFNRRADGLFHNTGFTPHNCEGTNFKMKRKFVSEKLRDIQSFIPDLTPRDFMKIIKKEQGLDIKYQTAYRSLRDLKQPLKPSVLQSFNKLESFFNWNISNNIGTHASLCIEENTLRQAFLCLNISKHVFDKSLPILAMSSFRFKSSGYALLVATGLNSNNDIFPIAIGIVYSKCLSTWTFFLENLKQGLSLDKTKDLVIISDREKDLTSIIQNVIPNAVHCYCLDSICKSVRSKFRKNFQSQIFEIAREQDSDSFSRSMHLLKDKDLDVYEYLIEIPHKHWAEYAIGRCRYGNLTLNNFESFNATFVQGLDLHPFEFIFEFVENAYSRIRKQKLLYEKEDGLFAPFFQKKLELSIEEAQYLTVANTDTQGLYRVAKEKGSKMYKLVDLSQQTCTCKFMIFNGFPCNHFLACIQHCKLNEEFYIAEIFKISALIEGCSLEFNFCDIDLLEEKRLDSLPNIDTKATKQKKRKIHNPEENGLKL